MSIMDVGTLGKFLSGGPDALEFLEALYPCHVATSPRGRASTPCCSMRKAMSPTTGLIAALGHGSYYLTFTSAGADHAEAWLRD